MPRHVVNRLRRHNVFSKLENRNAHIVWEWACGVLYDIGGILLIVGSVLFLPKYEDYASTGSWMFVAASIMYLTVSLSDLMEVFAAATELATGDEKKSEGHENTNQSSADADAATPASNMLLVDALASGVYVIGATLFIVGSILFLPDVAKPEPAAWCFIMGSVAFEVGAIANVLQIWESPDRPTMQYANLTAMSFVSGSAFYVSASIPYLYDFETITDSDLVFRLVAILYIVGSILFLIGGLFNMNRFRLVEQKLGR